MSNMNFNGNNNIPFTTNLNFGVATQKLLSSENRNCSHE
jgi:hypothetical protein